MAHAAPTRVTAPAAAPIVSLDVVDIRRELEARPRRASSVVEEHRALSLLASEMASNPRNLLQKLVELAVNLCGAHTAGISLLEGDVFRWEAVAGVFVAARGGTMPRDQSPCGACIDRDAIQLMHLADRRFPALLSEPRFVEALLIPFHVNGNPIGTVWVVSHTEDRKFDKEDERIVRELAQFASAGWRCSKLLRHSRKATDGRTRFSRPSATSYEIRSARSWRRRRSFNSAQRSIKEQREPLISSPGYPSTCPAWRMTCSTSRASRAVSFNASGGRWTFGRLSRPLSTSGVRRSNADDTH